MNRKTIRTVILLAVISLVGIVVTQIVWVNTAFRIQETQHAIQEKHETQLEKGFNDRVSIALTNVAEEILRINEDSTYLYDAVKQLRSNYFTVSINDTLHPFLLQSLLQREFLRRNIREDFEYGIYDCFTDSIVYGSFVALSAGSEGEPQTEAPQVKWDKSGHYFGVYFPNRDSYSISEQQPRIATWLFSTVIVLIIFLFFAYAISVMLKQKRLSEVKTDFINNMTHELKTPISTISLSSEVLLSPNIINEPERLNQYAHIIKNENNRLKNQVEKVLQLATLDREQVHLKKEQLDLHEIINESAKSLQLAVEANKGTITSELNARQHTVLGDRVHITNIIYNLLDNAVKYCDKEPRISITTESNGKWLIVRVKDNGIGMEQDHLKSIFDKFYRVPTGNVHNVKGFGLGLFYVRFMAEQHGGKITVESAIGHGSEFILKLPISNNHE